MQSDRRLIPASPSAWVASYSRPGAFSRKIESCLGFIATSSVGHSRFSPQREGVSSAFTPSTTRHRPASPSPRSGGSSRAGRASPAP